jgi:hypothetical protein
VYGDAVEGKILRRIMYVRILVGQGKPMRRAMLNCGHEIDVPRGLRPTVGKLTGCPECK